MRGFRTIIILWGIAQVIQAQTGGTGTYAFLDLPATARIASLGGKMVAVQDDDLNLSFPNPSLLSGSMENELTMNITGYFAGIRYGYAAFGLPTRPWGNLAAGIQFVNYGKFTEADETGMITGEFRASEYALQLMWSRSWDSLFTFGITLKPIFSAFERYTSFGLATDLGITYHKQGTGFTASLVARNFGTQVRTYQGTREPLPFEIMLGVSHKLRHAPFRFTALLQHLERYRLYREEEKDPSFPEVYTDDPGMSPFEDLAENLLRHLIVGVEFLPLDNLAVRLGYNYQRRRELQVPSRIGTVGFSWGFGLKVSRFQISYGRATYHLAGASNHFSVSTPLDSWFSRRDLSRR